MTELEVLPKRKGICRSCGREDCDTKRRPLTMRHTCSCSRWIPRAVSSHV